MPRRIPFVQLAVSQPRIARECGRRIARVLARGQFILGGEVRRFEAEFAEYCGAKHCVAVANGTEALMIALRTSGIAPGRDQEVITTPLTASFTAHAIVAAGARPVFAELEPDTLLLDPEAAARSMTRKTAAILPVHLYGQVCDLNAFRRLAKQGRCTLIQDAAQAHGSDYGGRPLVAFSGWLAFSFYPTKNLGALGDGGALVTNNRALAEAARLFRDGGRRGGSHIAYTEGVNSRLDEMQAALLRVNLRHLGAWNRRREQIAARYDRLLAEILPESVRPVPRRARGASSNHLYVIRAGRRDGLRRFLLGRGIETGVHYQRPLHLHPAFRSLGYRRGAFPNAERAAAEICSLPMHPFLTNAEVDRVAGTVAKFYGRG